MRTLSLALVGSLLSPALALAESNSSTPEPKTPDVQGWMVASRPGFPDDGMQVLPSTGVKFAGSTQILYLNHTGTTLRPSDTNDARTGDSTLVGQTTAVPPWTGTAAQWQQVLSCEQNMWSRFNVIVTDQDPGNVPHLEGVFTTLSSVLQMDPNYGGVSPFTIGCDVIPNSIVFTFASAFNNDPETVCEVMAQELAHSFGLDHELLAADPMTYLQYDGLQGFQDQTVSCGEYQTRDCGLQGECGPSQDSVTMLMTRVGPSGGGTNGVPNVQITSPSDGAQVPPGFTVAASATDDGSVTKVELWVDGNLSDTRTSGPFTFSTDASLAEGGHQIQTIAYDDSGQSSTAQIGVTIAAGAPDPGDGGGGGGGGGNGADPSDIVGGCQAGGGGAGFLLIGLALGGLVIRRRK